MDPTSDEEINSVIASLQDDKLVSDEETSSKKKDDKNPFKDKKNDESNTYDYSDDIDLSDGDW